MGGKRPLPNSKQSIKIIDIKIPKKLDFFPKIAFQKLDFYAKIKAYLHN